jgi:hypothetical protein
MPRGRPFKPGERPVGRAKGTPNKVTREARIALSELMDHGADEARVLWLKVAKRDPARALEILAKLGEYVIPKLARTEHSGPLGGAIPIAAATQQLTDDDAMKSYLKLVKGDAP